MLLELRRELPNEDFVYFADTANCPYGERSDDEIRDLTSRAVKWLATLSTKATIVACNTASAFSLDALRAWAGERHPIVGLVPALKPAVAASATRVIAVLATPGTLRGTLLQDVIHRFAEPAGVRIVTVVSPHLVPLVEAGRSDGPEARAELRRVLQPAVEEGADHVVLGCTHFPFLRRAIEEEFGSRFTLIDSGAAIARRTRRVLADKQALRDDERAGSLTLFTSGRADHVSRVASKLLGEPVDVREVTLRRSA